MLKELLKNANIYQAELNEKRARLEKVEWELLALRLSLDEMNLKSGERLNSDFSLRMHNLYESVKRLTEEESSVSAKIAELEQGLAAAKNSAIENAEKYNITLADVSEAEDEIVYEQLISADENRILTRLLAAQEAFVIAEEKLEQSHAKISEAERDEQVMRVQTAYYNAQHALIDFNARLAAVDESHRHALARDNQLLVDRLNVAKEEYERLLSEYGVLHLFSEFELAQTEYMEARAEHEAAKMDADNLPLSMPVSAFEKGRGVVTLELISRGAQQEEPKYTAPITKAPVREDTGSEAADYKKLADQEVSKIKREVERQRYEAELEMSKISASVKAARHEAEMLRREEEKAKADEELIRRAKLVAARNIKRSIIAANKKAISAKAVSRISEE